MAAASRSGRAEDAGTSGTEAKKDQDCRVLSWQQHPDPRDRRMLSWQPQLGRVMPKKLKSVGQPRAADQDCLMLSWQ